MAASEVEYAVPEVAPGNDEVVMTNGGGGGGVIVREAVEDAVVCPTLVAVTVAEVFALTVGAV